ncbi:MAG TPA: peptide chain release factor N(5)-glutamine methyltransferase [Candidatus Limnocylindria bacterium]|jgi:release factor glutamine methyltransferase|nr:peptide chain release factor N(5)-glutamine methyltransferase [Candidatus Limnocylindria bacterium]
MTPPESPAGALLQSSAGRLVADAAGALRAAGIPSPRLDAELLVGHAFGRDRAWLHAHPDAELGAADATALSAWVERRAAGEPIAYIRGFKEWLSLRIATDPRALIPRPETELLVEAAIAEVAARLVRDDATVQAWEVATGSGAVVLALALRFRTAIMLGRLRLAASDLSAEALELAAENLAAHGLRGTVTLACGDLLEPAALPGGRADLLVANLPYLTSAEVESGEGSLAWEPRRALDGGPDGLDLLRRLIADLPTGISPDGVALLEIGEGQAAAVREMVAALPQPTSVTTQRDLAGIERVVRVALG